MFFTDIVFSDQAGNGGLSESGEAIAGFGGNARSGNAGNANGGAGSEPLRGIGKGTDNIVNSKSGGDSNSIGKTKDSVDRRLVRAIGKRLTNSEWRFLRNTRC